MTILAPIIAVGGMKELEGQTCRVLSVDEAEGPGLLSPRLLFHALHRAQILQFQLEPRQEHKITFSPVLHIFLVASLKASNYKHKCRRLGSSGAYTHAPIYPRGSGNDQVCGGPISAIAAREEENSTSIS